MTAEQTPLVSIAMPVLDGVDLVGRALDSALAQDHPSLEVVVVDDASTDGTRELLRGYGDRIRVHHNERRQGQARTTNTAIRLCRGELVKFLHHDDALDPECVSRLAGALARHPTAGMAFCRRRVELASASPEAFAWRERYGSPPSGFTALGEVNDGSRLLGELLAAGLHQNWVGEPVCVMARRAVLEDAGLLSQHVRNAVDLDLWLRVMARHDVAFVDEVLATYRHSGTSHMGRERGAGRAWLDRLWILEGLSGLDGVAARFPAVTEMRDAERRVAFRSAMRAILSDRSSPVLPLWREHASWRLRAAPRAIRGRWRARSPR